METWTSHECARSASAAGTAASERRHSACRTLYGLGFRVQGVKYKVPGVSCGCRKYFRF